MSLGKKAVSPLVATILLIVFAMILGIIVMNVGGSYLALEEEKGDETVDVLGIIDKCVSAGAITEEESSILAGSLR
jgi:flagellin-like protein